MYTFYNQSNIQFLETNRAAQGLADQLQNLLLTLFQTQQRVQQRREVTKMNTGLTGNVLNVPELAFTAYQPLCKQDPSLCDFSMQEELPNTKPFLPIYDKATGGKNSEKGAGPPPAPNGFADQHTSSKARSMALINVEFSDHMPDSPFHNARSYAIDYVCDPQFLIDNYLPGLHSKYSYDALVHPIVCTAIVHGHVNASSK